jgi:hypothetical protein
LNRDQGARAGAREAKLPRNDKSISIMTGMIVAALYVILVLSFSRENYVLRGSHDESASALAAACSDGSKQVCALDRPICTPIAGAGREPSCVVSVRLLRQLIEQQQLKAPAEELEAAGADAETD